MAAPLRSVAGLAGLAIGAIAFTGEAAAQLKQPRCGGWPAAPDVPGILIGIPGQACYGLYFDRPRRNHHYGESKVIVAPGQGRFRVLNETEFEYTPRAGVKGWDRVVVQITVNGVASTREYRATTMEEFTRMGGTSTSPPPGIVTNRWGS